MENLTGFLPNGHTEFYLIYSACSLYYTGHLRPKETFSLFSKPQRAISHLCLQTSLNNIGEMFIFDVHPLLEQEFPCSRLPSLISPTMGVGKCEQRPLLSRSSIATFLNTDFFFQQLVHSVNFLARICRTYTVYKAEIA